MKLPQVHTAYVSFLIGVTPRATQRTLPRDFNSERRPPAAQDAFPGLNNFASPHMFFSGLVVNANFTSQLAYRAESLNGLQGCQPRREEELQTVKKNLTKPHTDQVEYITVKSGCIVNRTETHQKREKKQT
jgi:hypothetical protein